MVQVEVPGSKSITARALFLAAAADGVSTLVDPLVSDDTEAFLEGLRALGYDADIQPGRWIIHGKGAGPTATGAEVFCRDGATTARFLPALAATGTGTFRFNASEQMRRRPMSPVTEALQHLGASFEFRGRPHHHPFDLTSDGLEGGELTVDAGVSSQFLTALLLAAPMTRGGLSIRVSDLVSEPYIGITTQMMKAFGATVNMRGGVYAVPHQRYEPSTYTVEPDASSASYFFAAAALLGEEVTVPRLGMNSMQGDLGFVDVLARMGARVEKTTNSTTVTRTRQLDGVTVNMRDISDTMPTLAAIAPFAAGPTRIEDVYNTRVKECDRLEACAINLRRMGITVETGRDWIETQPGKPHSAEIICFGDHRIAMAFSIAGLRVDGGLTLDDPRCVTKTFPTFHEDLRDLLATLDQANSLMAAPELSRGRRTSAMWTGAAAGESLGKWHEGWNRRIEPSTNAAGQSQAPTG